MKVLYAFSQVWGSPGKLMNRTIIAVIALLLSGVAACAGPEENIAVTESGDELVVLAHGLGRSDWSMWMFSHRLEAAGYKVCSLDYPTVGESVETVLGESTRQINACIGSAPETHFVGHSLGGLVIRAYLQNNKDLLEAGRVGKLVLIGTPNKGSELADYLSDSWVMKIGGGIGQALMTGNNGLGQNLDQPDVNLGVIAGTKSSSLTSNRFKGPNDGLVSVESTKLQSMSDFITVEVNHTQMRYSPEVAEQTIHFLQHGRFRH